MIGAAERPRGGDTNPFAPNHQSFFRQIISGCRSKCGVLADILGYSTDGEGEMPKWDKQLVVSASSLEFILQAPDPMYLAVSESIFTDLFHFGLWPILNAGGL